MKYIFEMLEMTTRPIHYCVEAESEEEAKQLALLGQTEWEEYPDGYMSEEILNREIIELIDAPL